MSKKYFKSKKETTTKINIITLLLITGATLATIAPFLHILFPRESQVKVFGFRNARSFFYAIGIPITLFISSIILSYISNFISLQAISKAVRNIAFVFLTIASYYIAWTLWAKGDFPPILYYSMLVLVSLLFGYLINQLLKYLSTTTNRLSKISDKIPRLDHRIKTVNDIANIMPDDNKDIITYKAMVDVTGDDLNKTILEIKKELSNE